MLSSQEQDRGAKREMIRRMRMQELGGEGGEGGVGGGEGA
jgi:hypothetical protein